MKKERDEVTYLNSSIEGIIVGPFGLHFNRRPSLWMRFVLKLLGFKKHKSCNQE